MNAAELLRSRNGLVGIGVLAFAVFAVLALLSMTAGGEHPRALDTEVDLCTVLGEDVWSELQYPASGAIVRAPENSPPRELVCALELDPVPHGDRWARLARGDDADQVRRIATVWLNTTATLRRQSPSADSRTYAETFDREMVASGWSAQQVEGPWSWGAVYTMGEQEVAALAEDEGVVLWITASGVSPENLLTFTRSASQRIRPKG